MLKNINQIVYKKYILDYIIKILILLLDIRVEVKLNHYLLVNYINYIQK